MATDKLRALPGSWRRAISAVVAITAPAEAQLVNELQRSSWFQLLRHGSIVAGSYSVAREGAMCLCGDRHSTYGSGGGCSFRSYLRIIKRRTLESLGTTPADNCSGGNGCQIPWLISARSLSNLSVFIGSVERVMARGGGNRIAWCARGNIECQLLAAAIGISMCEGLSLSLARCIRANS